MSAVYNQTVSGCSNTGTSTSITDEALNTHSYCSDGLGRLTAVIEPTGTSTTYTNDILNNLIGVSVSGQANNTCTVGVVGQTRCFAYSSLSRLTSATNPESATTTYQYDNNGNLTHRTDANSTLTILGYDGVNRLTSKTYTIATGNPWNTAATPPVYYSYDPCFKGALCSVTSGANSSSYTYDGFGRVKTSTPTQSACGSPCTFTYGYSLTDQLTSMTYPSGRTISYGLDAADRITSVIKDPVAMTNYATIASYTAGGGIASMSLLNGVSHQLNWNDRSQPTSLQATSGSTSLLGLGFFPCPSSQLSCATGNNGNLQSQTITVPSLGTLTQTYSYDSLNRLTGSSENSGAWAQNYCHDSAGNRWVGPGGTSPVNLTQEVPQGANCTSGPYNSKNQMISWSYDTAGNVLNIPMGGTSTRSFTYDAENRQVLSTINGVATTYAYDGNGMRVSKTTGGITTTYVYDAFGNLAAEYGGSGTSPCGTPTCYVTWDHLGSTRMLTDNTGANNANLRRYDFLPFGQEIPSGVDGRTTGMGYTITPDVTDPKFTGEYRDPETTLDWLAVRAMSGAQGRFQSVDPDNAGALAGDPQTWNAYAYVGNNPLSYIDPSGLGFWSDLGNFFLNLGLNFITGGGWTVGNILANIGSCGGPLGNCTTLNSEPWSENAGLTNVQDPGRFVMDFSSITSLDDPNVFSNFAGALMFDTPAPTTKSIDRRPPGVQALASLFGYDRDIPLPSCFGGALGDTFSNLNPFTPSLSSLGEPAGTFYGALKFNQGLRYAATTASKTFGTTHLVYPYKSSVFRGLIKDSQKVGKVSMLGSLVLAEGQALWDEVQRMRAGHCQ